MADIVEFSPAQQQQEILPEIEDIAGDKPSKPYPIDALPEIFREATLEGHSIIKSPLAMSACSTLAAASMAAMGLAKARTLQKLVMPVGLMLLVEAESGERKSSGEKLFMSFVDKWQAEQLAILEGKIANYEADLATWKAQIKGCERRMEKQVKDNPTDLDAVDGIRGELRQLHQNEPPKPPIPKIKHADVTTEALVKSLKNYPVVGLLSAEGGTIFGGAAFQNGSGSNFMSKCNSLYSDEIIDVSRSGDSSAMLSNTGLTVSVSVQPQVFQEFLKKQGSTVWDSGFLPRCLIAAPETTQGTRLLGRIEDENRAMLETPALDNFNNRAYELLSMLPDTMTEEGKLNRQMIDFEPDALEYWVKFYNHIETSMGFGGYTELIRAAANRAAENAGRIAVIFHVFEHGLTGAVSLACIRSACEIVKWHLSEVKRFRYRWDLPAHYTHAANVAKRLARFAWERRQGKVANWDKITERHIITKLSPKFVEDRKTVKPVIMELMDAGYVLEWNTEAQRPYVRVNPNITELKSAVKS